MKPVSAGRVAVMWQFCDGFVTKGSMAGIAIFSEISQFFLKGDYLLNLNSDAIVGNVCNSCLSALWYCN